MSSDKTDIFREKTTPFLLQILHKIKQSKGVKDFALFFVYNLYFSIHFAVFKMLCLKSALHSNPVSL